MEFPIFKTKIEGRTQGFNLSDPVERRRYFELKAGKEIEKLREYLKTQTFVAYLLGKKNSGKGTYSKMFAEVVAPEKIEHFSIGDMIRLVDKEMADRQKRSNIIDFLEKNYRGRLSLKEVISALEKRNTKTLLPTELILVLVKREMEKKEKKALFIDGFSRDLDQINFSLFFRDLIGHRDDPDVFVLIDVPEAVLDERIKYRRVCPKCHTPRNLKLLPTSKIGFDRERKEFYLICDEPNCQGIRMEAKEGDELGIEPIRERLLLDEKLIKQAFSLYGVLRILLRNSIPQNIADQYVDDYEITPQYEYRWEKKTGKVKIIEMSWAIKDDQGVPSYSLLAPPVAISLIKQMVQVLEL